MSCRVCGCSDFDACVYDDGQALFSCYWIEDDLCSFCHMLAQLRPTVENVTTGGLL